jgi:hypothetical protein
MRPTFAVKITHHDKPLQGVLVDAVTIHDKRIFSDVTGRDGTVYVTKLPAGEYWLKAEYLGVHAAYQCFNIENHSSRKAKQHLKFQWGDDAPATRQLAGRLIDSQPGHGGTPLWNMTHRVDIPIRAASLMLKPALTGVVYTATSDDRGEFAFPNVPKGTYVLQIDAGTLGSDRGYDRMDLVIDVNAKARKNSVLLTNTEPGGGSCGGISLTRLRTSE